MPSRAERRLIGLYDRFWYRTVPAKRLATLRIMIGAYAWVYLLTRVPALFALARTTSPFKPVGPVALLAEPLSATSTGVACLAMAVLGVAFIVGWRFVITGPLFAVVALFLMSYRNSFGMIFHTENLIALHVIVLAISRSADAYSLDARGRPVPEDHGRYGWPIQLICAITVSAYFIAGITKLRHAGFGWVTSDTLRNFVAYDNVRKIELGAGHSHIGAWLVRYDWLFPPLAAISLAAELGAPLALLHRRGGMAWCVLAWGFHLGVLLVMFIVFHYPLIGIGFASFFPVEKLSRWAIRKWRKQ